MGLLAHPLDPVTTTEIIAASKLIRKKYASTKVRFQQIELQEPPKSELKSYIEAERLGQTPTETPARVLRAYVWVYADADASKVELHKIHVNLTLGTIQNDEWLPDTVQAPIHFEEMIGLEQICLKHPAVQKEIERLHIPTGFRVCLYVD